MSRFAAFLFISFFTLCSFVQAQKKISQPAANIKSIKFLGEYDIPYNLKFKNTTVGGLSGIDYDAKQNVYYLISDDRSEINPARFYTAKIIITSKGIDSVHFLDVQFMKQPDQTVYPGKKQDRFHTPDPEAIRYNPVAKNLVWSSEGERIVKEKDTVLENPSVIKIATNGSFKKAFALPDNLVMHATEKGPRQNGVLEGMSFADNYQSLYVNVEEPLYEDGPRADVTDTLTYIRILKFNAATGTNTAQFAYKLEPVAHPAIPANAFKINGVPDILNIGKDKFLVIERSFSTGKLACTIRVFETDLSKATNIKDIPSLKTNHNFTPAEKKLLINMDDLGIYIDNIEGVTLGPRLPNGHKTLVFIADNNFAMLEKAQVLLFEIME
ncbi:MAG: esterase-like activity of phytase family protein [Bacteroidetes bacterium]|nr:esterase-like activity of phytase family protein [Bacteroidota bacterium]